MRETKCLETLPSMMTVAHLQSYLGINRGGAYALTHRTDFPKIIIGRRILIPKDAFLRWIDAQTGGA